MSDELNGVVGNLASVSVATLTSHLRFVKRPVVEDGDIKMRMVLQQARQDIDSGELTWVDVPVCDEATEASI